MWEKFSLSGRNPHQADGRAASTTLLRGGNARGWLRLLLVAWWEKKSFEPTGAKPAYYRRHRQVYMYAVSAMVFTICVFHTISIPT